jgi:XTP/dITP diphosphohydrolase
MEIWIASTNRGKVAEFESIFEPLTNAGWKIKTPQDLEFYFAPEENGASFADNARIKARSLRAVAPHGVWIVADDSGLAVEGLNGLPGIHSARYAGPKASDAENRSKLIKMMALKPMANRNAAFVCALHAFDPQGAELLFESRCEGEIGKTEMGKNGFGYDALFIPHHPENTGKKTMAEITPELKNRLSHRGQAARLLLDHLLKAL